MQDVIWNMLMGAQTFVKQRAQINAVWDVSICLLVVYCIILGPEGEGRSPPFAPPSPAPLGACRLSAVHACLPGRRGAPLVGFLPSPDTSRAADLWIRWCPKWPSSL